MTLDATAASQHTGPGQDALDGTTTAPTQHDLHQPVMLDFTSLTLLCRAANLVRRHLDTKVLYDAHLTWTSWDVLQLIAGRPGILTRHVATTVGISKSLVTRTCDTLIERGLIVREREHTDQRRTLLYPSPRGQHLIERLRPQLINAYERYVATGRAEVDNAFRKMLHDLFLPEAAPTPADTSSQKAS